MSANEEAPVVKIVICGDGGTGKTTFVTRHYDGAYVKKYIATHGFERRAIRYETTRGPIVLDVWDTAGQESKGLLNEAYYIGAHAAIIFFDLTSMTTFENVKTWNTNLVRTTNNPNLPVVIVGSKMDLKAQRRVDRRCVVQFFGPNADFVELSTRLNLNIEEPFLHILRNLYGDPALQFIKEKIKKPEYLAYDEEQMKLLTKASENAQCTDLPMEDDHF